MSSQNNKDQIPSPAQTEGASHESVTQKTWHKPVISRIEIAQTLSGPSNPGSDNDSKS